MNYLQVDQANTIADQDFRLDALDEDEAEEAEEASDRVNEARRIGLFLAEFMTLDKVAGCSVMIMHEWSNDRDSYYKDEDGQESLFYRGFEIKKVTGQWFMEDEEGDVLLNFCVTDLREGLRCIDFINEGEM